MTTAPPVWEIPTVPIAGGGYWEMPPVPLYRGALSAVWSSATGSARLTELAGRVLGEGIAGPANIRLGLQESLSAVHDAVGQCLQQARLDELGVLP